MCLGRVLNCRVGSGLQVEQVLQALSKQAILTQQFQLGIATSN